MTLLDLRLLGLVTRPRMSELSLQVCASLLPAVQILALAEYKATVAFMLVLAP